MDGTSIPPTLDLIRHRVSRFGNLKPLNLVGDDLLGSLQLGKSELVVTVRIEHAKDRMCGLGQRFVVFINAQHTVTITIGGLECRLNGRLGDLGDSRVKFVRT